MIKNIARYFDKLEDRVRGRLSGYPILYTFIGGVAIVLFWRGVWITTDQIAYMLPHDIMWVDGLLSVAASVFILLITGLFVSFFVSDQIILSGMKREKKLVEKTETEVRQERGMLYDILDKVNQLGDDIAVLKKNKK